MTRLTGPFVPIYDPGKRRGQAPTGTMIGNGSPTFTLVGFASYGATLGNTRCVAKDGDYCYVTNASAAASTNDLYVIDVSDPEAPALVGTLDHADLAGSHCVTVDDGFAYVAANTADRLVVVDVSTPSAPSHVASVANATSLSAPTWVAKIGNYAYVLNGFNSLYTTVVDVSTPASPTVVGSVNTNVGNNRSVLASDGSYCYSAHNGTNGPFSVTDVTTPTAPTVVGTISASSVTNGGAVLYPGSGDYVYLDRGSEGGFHALVVIDVSTPASPVVAGSVLTGFNIFHMVKLGDWVYSHGFDNAPGLCAFNVADPTHPRLGSTFFYDSTFTAFNAGLAGEGSYLYKNTATGLAVVQVTPP